MRCQVFSNNKKLGNNKQHSDWQVNVPSGLFSNICFLGNNKQHSGCRIKALQVLSFFKNKKQATISSMASGRLMRCQVLFLIMFLLFFSFYGTSLSLAGKSGLLYLGKAQRPQKQHYPFLSVCAVFSCVQTMVRLPVFGIFNTFKAFRCLGFLTLLKHSDVWDF